MAYSPIEESYMNGFVTTQFATPEPEPVLLAQNKNMSYPGEQFTDTGGGAAVGTRLKMPSGLNTPENIQKVGGEILPAGGAMLKGAGQASVGMYGDIEGLGRMVLNYMGVDVNKETKLPTTEDVKTFLDKYIPVDEKYATFEKAGELASPAGAYGLGKAGIKAIKSTKGMPVGMSTKAVAEGVDDLGFYSAARQAVDSIQQPKGTGDQFLKQIEKTPGVKPDEIKWTGLDEFLKSKKSVTKVEVQEYLDKNRVEVKEVQLGENKGIDVAKELNAKLADKGYTVTYDAPNDNYKYLSPEGKTTGYVGLPKEIRSIVEEVDFTTQPKNATKFSKYTLPGGENYREVLLTLPRTGEVKAVSATSDGNVWDVKMADGKEISFPVRMANDKDEAFAYAQNQTGTNFKSSHFDQPNILAHLRVNDRVDTDGKKVLFVEEVQSDWHQAGRKRGYAGDTKKELEAINAERTALMDEKLRYEKLAEPYVNEGKDAPQDIVEGWTLASNRLQSLQMKQDRLSVGVPDAPFKTTWSELAMKRAIQMASEGGYDRIAFTTGKTQAERFDLSKQVERITAIKDGDNFKIMGIDIKGNSFDLGKKSVDELPEILGKDLADKIAKQETPNAQYAGKDLVVGGEGMKGFYDDILPKFLNKYAKKWDAKAGMTEISVGKGKPTQYADFNEYSKAPAESNVPVHYIDITPKMRESVMTKGQPMFAVGGASAGAASQQEENK